MNTILNEDCLYEIFLKQSINIRDLLEIASTCTDFKLVAQRVYKFKFRKIDHYEEMAKWKMAEIEEYLRFFGEFIHAFDTNPFDDPVEVLYLLSKYCKNLKILHCVGSLDMDFKRLKIVCANLEEFDYCNGTFEGRLVFGKNSPLKKLRLHNCDAELPKWHLPNLVDATLHLLYQVGVSRFLKRNAQIIRLDLSCLNYNFNAIKHLVYLEEFVFHSNFDEILTFEGFENLKELKRLSINGATTECIYQVLDGIKRSTATLDTLSVNHYDINSAIITRIYEFKTIEHLTFKCELASRDLDSDHLIGIINNLPILKELICDSILFEVEVAHRLLANFAHKLESAFVKVNLFRSQRDFMNMTSISAISQKANVRVELQTLLAITNMNFKQLTHDKFVLHHFTFAQHMSNRLQGNCPHSLSLTFK